MSTFRPSIRFDTPLRQDQRSLTRQRICDAAGEVFLKRGFAATSMEEIASHGGIGRSTIYKHFHDKDQILSVIAEQFAPRLVEMVKALPGPRPTSIQTSCWLEELTSFLARHNTAAILLTELGGSANPHPAIPALGMALLHAFADRLPAFADAVRGQAADALSYARAAMLLRDIGWSTMQCVQHENKGFGRNALIVVGERIVHFVQDQHSI